MKIINVLLNAQEPLTREQIAEKAHLSVGYTIDMIKRLMQYDYVVGFHIGKRKLIFYALSGQGYDALRRRKEETEAEQSKTGIP